MTVAGKGSKGLGIAGRRIAPYAPLALALIWQTGLLTGRVGAGPPAPTAASSAPPEVSQLAKSALLPGRRAAAPDAKKGKKPPCAANIGACPNQGCGSDFDPNLNERKNIRANDPEAGGNPEAHSLAWMKGLDDPENFSKGDSRETLQEIGEGKKIRVVAYVIAAKREGGESCNCGLRKVEETDNHLVLVTKATVDKFPLGEEDDTDEAASKEIFHSRELESVTAEFTPRVRLFDRHPNFKRTKLQPMIDDADQKALLVRVTGLLLFDSEHFLQHHLVRANNWEIHPVLKFEVCQTKQPCKVSSDEGWKSLDDSED